MNRYAVRCDLKTTDWNDVDSCAFARPLAAGGEVKDVRQFGGKVDFGSILYGLRLEKLAPTFPDANVQQIVRAARLLCPDNVKACLLTLLPSETAFRVVDDAPAESSKQP